MARYIDADKLIEKWQNTLKDKNPDDLAYKCFTLFIDGLKKEPSADVVPKSEVEKIFEEIEKLMNSLDRRYMASGNPKQSWGIRGAMAEIAELKKKYTESEGK